MKAEVRISINDYDGNSEEFIVESGRKSLTPTLSHGAGEGERCGGRGRHRSLSPLPSLHGMERGSCCRPIPRVCMVWRGSWLVADPEIVLGEGMSVLDHSSHSFGIGLPLRA